MLYQKQVPDVGSLLCHCYHLLTLAALEFADKKSKKKVGKAAAPAPPDIFVGLYAGPSLER